MISAPGPRTGVTAAHPGQAAMVAVVVNVIFPHVTTGV
jgi:hypothetical protein